MALGGRRVPLNFPWVYRFSDGKTFRFFFLQVQRNLGRQVVIDPTRWPVLEAGGALWKLQRKERWLIRNNGGNELSPRFLGQRCFEVCFGLITGLFDLDTSYKVVIYAKKPSGWTEKSSFSLIFVIYIWYTLTCIYIYICIRLATAVLCCGCFCTVLKSLKRREETLQSIELGCVRLSWTLFLFLVIQLNMTSNIPYCIQTD